MAEDNGLQEQGAGADVSTLDALHLDGKGLPGLDDAEEQSLPDTSEVEGDDVKGFANVQSANRVTFEQMQQGAPPQEGAIPVGDQVVTDPYVPTEPDNNVEAQFQNPFPAFGDTPEPEEPEARAPSQVEEPPAEPGIERERPVEEAAPGVDREPAAAAGQSAVAAPETVAAAEPDEDEESITDPQTALLTVTPANGTEDQLTKLTINATTNDIDAGGDAISAIEISGLPDYFQIVDGNGDSIGERVGDTWRLVDPTEAQFDDIWLKNIDTDQDADFSGDFTLRVSVVTTEPDGQSIIASQDLPVHIEAAADAPGLAVADSAGMENTWIPLTIDVTNMDAVQEAGAVVSAPESQLVFISGLPNGATLNHHARDIVLVDGPDPIKVENGVLNRAFVIDGVAIPAGVQVVDAADLQDLKVLPAPDGSRDFTLDVWATSNEGSNNDYAITGAQTIQVDVGVVDPSAAGSGRGLEDQWTALDLSANVNQADGTEQLRVFIKDLPEDAQLAYGDGALVTRGDDGRFEITGRLGDLKLRWLTGHSDADIGFNLVAEVRDGDTDADSAAIQSVAPDFSATEVPVTVTIQAVADAPTLSASAIGVEDKWFSLGIGSALVDTDGSETLSLTVSGPAGYTLSAGTETAPGVWALGGGDIPGLKIKPPRDSDVDFDLTITATATEGAAGDQVAVKTAATSTTITVQVLSDADLPYVAVDSVPKHVAEDSFYDLRTLLADNRPAVAGALSEFGGLDGLIASSDGSETLTFRIAPVEAGSRLTLDGQVVALPETGFWEIAAADVFAGKVAVGGPPDWASTQSIHFDIRTVATEARDAIDDGLQSQLEAGLSRDGVAVSETRRLTLVIDPVHDTATLADVNAGVEDQAGGITVDPVVTFTDADLSERPTGTVSFTSTDAGLAGGHFELDGAPVTMNSAAGTYSWEVPASAFTASGNTWTLSGLKFFPATHLAEDVTYTLAVPTQDLAGGPVRTLTATGAIAVAAVADTPTLGTDDTALMESAAGALVIPLGITATTPDADGSETVYVYIKGLPGVGSLSHVAETLTADLTVDGLTIPASDASPVYKVAAADLGDLTVTVPQGYSDDLALTVWTTTTEARNGDMAISGPETLLVDIGIVDPAASGAGTGREDGWVELDLSAGVNAADGSETLSVFIEDLPPGAELARISNGTAFELKTYVGSDGQTHSGYEVTGELGNAKVRWTAGDQDADITVRLRAVAADRDADPAADAGGFDRATAITDTVAPDTSDVVATVTAIVQAVADAPTLSASAIGVEDKWFDLAIETGLTDTDGSETLSLTVSGPAGYTLSAGTETAPGVWALVAGDIPGLKIKAARDSDADFDLTITATATEGAADAAVATATTSRTITVQVLSDADTPEIAVVPDIQHTDEDTFYNLREMLDAQLSGFSGPAVGGAMTETGGADGATTVADGSESLTFRIAPVEQIGLRLQLQDAATGAWSDAALPAGGYWEVAAADIFAGRVRVGGPADWASTGNTNADAIHFNIRTVATEARDAGDDLLQERFPTLIRDGVAMSPEKVLTLVIDPVHDTAQVVVTASGQEDGLSGPGDLGVVGTPIPITPTVTLHDTDFSEKPNGRLVITTNDPDMIGGALAIDVGTIVKTVSGGTTTWTITGANFTETAPHSNVWTLDGLTFLPERHLAETATYDLAVTIADSQAGATRDVVARDATIAVAAIADVPVLGADDAGAYETVSGVNAIPLTIEAGLVDTDGSETLYVYVSGILADAATLSAYDQIHTSAITIDGVTIAASPQYPVYRLTAAQLQGLKLEVAQGYSSDMELTVYAASVEDTGDVAISQPTTLLIDLGVLTPESSGTVGGEEDRYIALSTLVTNPQADDATDTFKVYIEDLEPGARLYKLVGSDYVELQTTTYPDARGAAHTGYDVTALRDGGTGARSGVYVKWNAQHQDADIDLTLRSVIYDTDAGTARHTAFGEIHNDIAETVRPVTVTVTAEADAPTVTASAIGVEDQWVALGIDANLVDIDGSEVLTVTIAGVPGGIVLSNGEVIATAPDGSTTWKIGPAPSNVEMAALLSDLKMANLPADSDVDFDLVVTATATETVSGQVGQASASTSTVVHVDLLSDADKPEISVIKDAQHVAEDGFLDLRTALSGTFNDGTDDSAGTNLPAVDGASSETGSTGSDTDSGDHSEVLSYRVYPQQDGLRVSFHDSQSDSWVVLDHGDLEAGGYWEFSAADVLDGRVKVGGAEDWASQNVSDVIRFKITTVATETNGAADDLLEGGLAGGLTRETVSESDPATLTLIIDPVSETDTPATLAVTASGFEDGLAGFDHSWQVADGAGIAVTPTITLYDIDGSEVPTGTVVIRSDDPAMIAGTLTIGTGTIAQSGPDANGIVTWTISGADFVETSSNVWGLSGLTFHPADDLATDPTYDISVSYQDTIGTATGQVTLENQTITVVAVADKPAVETANATGMETALGFNTIRLDIHATRGGDSSDNSEALYIYVTNLPNTAGSVVSGDPNMATYSSGTVPGTSLSASATNPVYRIGAAYEDTIQLQIKSTYSDDLALKVYSGTIESENNDVALSDAATLRVDIGVLDPTITGAASVSGKEDAYISLSTMVIQAAAKDSGETMKIYIEDVPAGASLYYKLANGTYQKLNAITFTDPDGNSHTGYDVSSKWTSSSGRLTSSGGVYIKWDATHADTDISLTIRSVVTDGDADAATDAGGLHMETAYGDLYHDTAQATATMTVKVLADADAPSLTGVTAVGVEDKWVALNFGNVALVDTDGSENLTLTIAGVPDGLTLVSPYTTLSHSTLTVNGVTTTTWTIGPAQTNVEMQGWLRDLKLTGLTAESDYGSMDFTLTVIATATEEAVAGQIATNGTTRTTTSVVQVAIYGDADTPTVTVIEGESAAHAVETAEDSFYNLASALKGHSGEDADGVYGATSLDGSEALWYSITATEDCRISIDGNIKVMHDGDSELVQVADVIAGKIKVGGLSNWGQAVGDDGIIEFKITPMAVERDGDTAVENTAAAAALSASNVTTTDDLGRAPTATGAEKPFYLHVSPQADETYISLEPAGYEDHVGGIAFAPTITLTDTDGSEHLTGSVDILIASDASGGFPGDLVYSGESPMVDGGVVTLMEGDPTAARTYHLYKVPVGDLEGTGGVTYQLDNLKFVPDEDSDLDIEYRIRVTTEDGGSTYSTITSRATLVVEAKADAPIVAVHGGAEENGVVTVHGNEDSLIRLNLSAQLKDADGSENLANAELRNVPDGWTVAYYDGDGVRLAYVNESTTTPGTYELNTAYLDPRYLDPSFVDAEGHSRVSVVLTPPLHSDVDANDVVFWARSIEDTLNDGDNDDQVLDGYEEAISTITFNVAVNAVADQPTLMVSNARVIEDGSVRLDIRAALTDIDLETPSEILTVKIEGVPAGGSFKYYDADGNPQSIPAGQHVSDAGDGTEVWTFSALQAKTLVFAPAHDSNIDATLRVTAIATDSETDGTGSLVDNVNTKSADIQLIVTGVADGALDPAGNPVTADTQDGGQVLNPLTATGSEDQLIDPQLGQYRVADTDVSAGRPQSETLSAVISGIPLGVAIVLVDGSNTVLDTSQYLKYIGTDSQGGAVWSVAPDYLDYVHFKAPSNYAGTFNVKLRLITTEDDGASAHVDKTLAVTVRPVVDPPSGGISTKVANSGVVIDAEDEWAGGGIPITLNAHVNDGGGNGGNAALGDGTAEKITDVDAIINVDALVGQSGFTSGIYVTFNGVTYEPVQVTPDTGSPYWGIVVDNIPVIAATSVSIPGLTLYGLPEDWSTDVPVTLWVTVADDTGNDGIDVSTDTWDISTAIALAPVADEPTLSFVAPDTCTYLGESLPYFDASGGGSVILTGQVGTNDADGSESLYLIIDGVPVGVKVSGGYNNGDGSWTLPYSGNGASTITLVNHNGDEIRPLTITAKVLDDDPDSSLTDTEEKSVTVMVNWGDATGGPGGSVVYPVGAVDGSLRTYEDGAQGALTLAGLTFTATDPGSDPGTADDTVLALNADGTITNAGIEVVGTMSVVLDVPKDWGISGSCYLIQSDGDSNTYTVPYSQIGTIRLVPPTDYAGADYNLGVRAVVTNTEGWYAAAATTMKDIPILVIPETDGANIGVGHGTANEDSAVPISFSIDAKETAFYSEVLTTGTITVTIDTAKAADNLQHLPGSLSADWSGSGQVLTCIDAAAGTYTIQLTTAQIDAFRDNPDGFLITGLMFTPDPNFSGSVTLRFSTPVGEPGDDPATTTVTETVMDVETSGAVLTFSVDAVRDATTFADPGILSYSGMEDVAIDLGMTIAHQDLAGTGLWGSESVSVVISGVPVGAVIEGAYNNGPGADGRNTWTVKGGNLTLTTSGITLHDVKYLSAQDDSTDADLTFTTYVFEKGDTKPPQITSATYHVTVAGLTDGATLNPQSATGSEDVEVAIDLGGQLLDITGSSEVTTITLTGVPEGATFFGYYDADHDGAVERHAVGHLDSTDTATGTSMWSFSQTDIDNLGLMNGGKLYFLGGTHDSGSWEITAQASTLDTDGGLAGAGDDAQVVLGNPLTFTVALTGVADAPTLSATAVAALDEDQTTVLDIRAALVDTDSESLTLTLTGAPDGTAFWVQTGTDTDGAPVWTAYNGTDTNGDGIDDVWTIPAGAATAIDGVRLQPPHDYNGSFTLTVAATATEGPDQADGGAPVTIEITVNAVNDAPTIDVSSGGGAGGGTHGDPIHVVKDLAGVTNEITIGDIDSPTLSKMTLTIGGTGAADADGLALSDLVVSVDEAGFLVTTLDGATQVTIGYDHASQTLTFTGPATPLQFEELAHKVILTSTDHVLTPGERTVTITVFNDDGKVGSDDAAVTITGTATLTGAALGSVSFSASGELILPANAVTTAEDAAPVTLALDMASVADPDLPVTITGAPVGTVFVTTSGINLVADAGGVSLTAGQLSGLVIDLPGNWNGSVALTVTATAQSTILVETVTVTATAVNDAPTNAAVTLAGTAEDTAFTFTTASLLAQAADIEGDSLSVSDLAATYGTVTANGSGGYIYTPTGNFSGADTITYKVLDGNGGTVAGSASFEVAAVNDAPTAIVSGTSPSVSGTVTQPILVVPGTIAIADVDGNQLTGMTVRISGNAGAGDSLALSGIAVGLSPVGTLVISDSQIGVSYDGSTGTLTFSGLGTHDQYETIAKGVVLSNSTGAPEAGTRQFTLSLYDEQGGQADIETSATIAAGTELTGAALGEVRWSDDNGAASLGDTDVMVLRPNDPVGFIDGGIGNDTLLMVHADGTAGDWVFHVQQNGSILAESETDRDFFVHIDQGTVATSIGEIIFNGDAKGRIEYADDNSMLHFDDLDRLLG